MTVNSDDPLTPPNRAEIVVVPTLLELSNPLAVMFATLEDDDHFATLVTSCELPSENVAVAVNC